VTFLEKRDQCQTCQKAANMRDIGNPAAITAKRLWRGGKLKANPATKNMVRTVNQL